MTTALPNLDTVVTALGGADTRFGVLAESNTTQLTVIARNADVAVGDLFLIPSRRGGERVYVFRTTQYANIMNRTLEMGDVARTKLTLPDSYLSDDLAEETLLELSGMLLGYAESAGDAWAFRRPRRLPDHLSDVYRVAASNPAMPAIMRALLEGQLGPEPGKGGLLVGDLLAGEAPLRGVTVTVPPQVFSHHLGIFGRTGSGKSNLMMVLLRSVFEHNRAVAAGQVPADARRLNQKVSFLAIDPHDEFRTWHATTGGADGVRGMVNALPVAERPRLVDHFYYLSAKDLGATGPERRVLLSRADLTPDDLISVMEFSEQQAAFCASCYGRYGEDWIPTILRGDLEQSEGGTDYLPGTISAVQRRLGFLEVNRTRLFTRFAPEAGLPYQSTLPDLICTLEHGRIVVVDTTLMSELEQFLLTTVVARTLFSLRKALRGCDRVADLPRAIQLGLGRDPGPPETLGSRHLAESLQARLEDGSLPYRKGDRVVSTDDLPLVNIVVEEAPSILNPARLKFGSVFRDISRQGRKFGIGLSVVSQQVTAIDAGILTQINSELTMGLGNEDERRAAVRNASGDLGGFERELLLLGKGQILLTTTFKDVPVPVQVRNFDHSDNTHSSQ